jgi:predicted small lipoprotein YifL
VFMTARMLRRSVAAFIVCASALALAGCGIKGPLKLPPGVSAPAPTGTPPGTVPTESPTTAPAPVTPPVNSPNLNDDKENKE